MAKECAYCDAEIKNDPNWSNELKGWLCDECKEILDKEKRKK